MISIAVLASGVGSNFDAIADVVERGQLRARIAAVLSDREQAPVLEKARKRGIAAFVIPRESDRDRHDAGVLRILDSLPEGRPRFLVLAGYLKILSPSLIEAFRTERDGSRYSRIVNIHPSLLPAFPGLEGYAQAFAYGAKVAGTTVHLVDEGLDSGPICAQEAFSIGDGQSLAEVEAKGKSLEHRLFPETLAWVLPERFMIQTRTNPSGVSRDYVRPS